MERDFEKEFKELKQSEAPDLWNRIEAGITPKPAVSYVQKKAEQVAEQKQGIVRVYRWALLAAACLSILIILPVLSLTESNSSSSDRPADMSGGMEVPAEDGGWSAADEGAEPEPAEEKAEISMDEYAGEAGDIAADFYAGADEITEENVMGASLTNGAETAMSGASKKEMAREDDSADWNSILQEGQLLNKAIIEVLQTEQKDNTGEEYIVRAIVVSSDEEAFLPGDMELTLICNAETLYDIVRSPQKKTLLQMGETYTVDLRYEGNGDFIVTKAVK